MKKLLCLIVALTIVILPIVSRANGDSATATTQPDEGGAVDSTTTAGDAATESTEATPDLPEKDLGGANFQFYVMGEERNVNNYSIEIYAEEENADPINDAVYARNRKLEDKYNFTISEFAEKQGSLAGAVNKSLLADEDIHQVFMMNIGDATNLANKGFLTDIKKLQYIDLSKLWWDQTLNNAFSVANKLYYAAGDMNLMLNNATWAVFFNKKLIADIGLELPYTAVKNNTWTLEEYYKMQVAGTRDLDGDGVMNAETDMWGTVGDNMNTSMLYFSAGGHITGKDENDIPYLDLYTERSASVMEKVLDIMLDNETSINGHKYTSKYNNVWSDLLRKNFREDRAMFYIAGLLSYTLLRDMESEFGMVPMPKFDAQQANYYTTVNPGNCNTISIPNTNKRIEDTGFILEAMVAESSNTIKPAYYDVALSRKYMRDEESREMLDIILSSRTFDLAIAFDWGGSYGVFDKLTSSSSRNFASECEKIFDRAQTAMQKTVEEFNANA